MSSACSKCFSVCSIVRLRRLRLVLSGQKVDNLLKIVPKMSESVRPVTSFVNLWNHRIGFAASKSPCIDVKVLLK